MRRQARKLTAKAKNKGIKPKAPPPEDLKLSTRTQNALLEGGIKTVGGLIKKTEESLKEIEGMGDKGIAEVSKALKKLNLNLKGEINKPAEK